jgi:hypothetical protein
MDAGSISLIIAGNALEFQGAAHAGSQNNPVQFMLSHGIGNQFRTAGVTRRKYQLTMGHARHGPTHIPDTIKNARRRQGPVAGACKHPESHIPVRLNPLRAGGRAGDPQCGTLRHGLARRRASGYQYIHEILGTPDIPNMIDFLSIGKVKVSGLFIARDDYGRACNSHAPGRYEMIDGPDFSANAFTETAFGTGSALNTAPCFRYRLFRGEAKVHFFEVVSSHLWLSL